MGGTIARYFVPVVLAFAPAVLFLMTWAPTGRWLLLQAYIRDFSLPVIASEAFVVVVAFREGLLRSVVQWNWQRPALVAIAVLLIIAVATAFTAPLSALAIRLTLFWILHALFALSMVSLCGRRFAAADLVRCYLIGFAVLVVLFLLFTLQVPDWSEFDWTSGLPAFSHIRHAGYYFAAMAALAIGLMSIAAQRAERVWAFALATIGIALSIWTGSRGAVLAIACALGAGLLFNPALRSLRGLGGGLASFALAAGLVALAPATNHEMMGAARTVEATRSNDVTTGRTAMWENVVEAVQERPLFGYGEGQMRKVAPFGPLVQPHNVVLQVALAWGLVGLLCVAVLAVAFALRALSAVRREGGFLVPPFLGMAAIAGFAMYDGALYYALPISIFLALGGTITAQFPTTARRNASRGTREEVTV